MTAAPNPLNKSLLTVLSLVLLFALIPTSHSEPMHTFWKVTNELATRSMRYHHLLFHNVRNSWNTLDSATQAEITKWGWKPPRPSHDAKGNALLDNGSGMDFFYMHRTMIALVNKLQAKYGYSGISGFTTLPAKNSVLYPMPPVYTGPTQQLSKLIKYYKADSWYTYMKQEEAKMRDPKFLRTMTLAQFGAYIEWTSDVHQGMHFRFSAYNPLMRAINPNELPIIDPKWDVNTSNWLGDLYCSQVNPWFWKLHGWIDNRIADWQAAHGVKTINWAGAWNGGPVGNLPKDMNITDDPNVRFLGDDAEGDNMEGMHTSLEAMEAVVKILADKGVLKHYLSDLSPNTNPDVDDFGVLRGKN